MSGYCPAGKCECNLWKPNLKTPELGMFACRKHEDQLIGYQIMRLGYCPWPSRQVPVKLNGRYCPDIKRDCQYLTPSAEELNEMLAKAKATGRLAGIEGCIKAVNDELSKWNQDKNMPIWEMLKSKLNAVLEKLRGRAAGPGENE